MLTASTCIPLHVVYCVENVLTALTSIALNALEILMSSIDVSTYIVMMVWLKSPQSQLSKNFLWIENQLNIKKVMGRNMWMCFVLTVST